MNRYSRNDVVRIAVEKERGRFAFYRMVVDSAKTDALRNLFEYLAKQERAHIRRFQSLFDEQQDSQLVASFGAFGPEEATLYVKALLASDVFENVAEAERIAREITGEGEAIRLAMGFEKDAILFFHGMLDGVEGPDKAVVREIIEEEKDHLRRLHALKQQIAG